MRPTHALGHDILDQVFEAAWAAIKTHDPFRDFDQDEKLQSALRQKLWTLAANGERDPQLLRSLLLSGMPVRKLQTIAV